MFYHVLTDIWYTFRIDKQPKKKSSQAQLLSMFRESPRRTVFGKAWAHVNYVNCEGITDAECHSD